ncbi:MAG TPA: cytochrome c3 family protein [Pseudobdellovibrionaceae bacterium]|nr:cytochrome c3 family protein [Pseudobdellovibrionaceae bacterium]
MLKFIFSFVLLFFLNSCNETSEPKSSPVKNTKLGATVIYPHSESFIKGQHGPSYYQDSKTCKSCHGEDFSGGTSKISCTTCHQSFPHTPGWSMPSNHAKTYLLGTTENKQQCLKCHQSNGSVSQSLNPAMSCNSCHSTFPHAEDFVIQHKDRAKENSGACIDCHNRSIKHVSTLKEKISCNTCHGENFPHPPGWSRSDLHGSHFVKLDESQRSSCLACHTSSDEESSLEKLHKTPKSVVTDIKLIKDPSVAPTCKECHVAFPHPPKFKSKELHPIYAKVSEGKCTLCHSDYKKYLKGDGCLNCHDVDNDDNPTDSTRIKWVLRSDEDNGKKEPQKNERIPQSQNTTKLNK